jgi:isoleucyl-tRNA synthetase
VAAQHARLAGADDSRERPDRVAPDWEKLRPYYYPTSVLVTSRDIITLWVARMVLTGLYNLGEIPFHHVYITPKLLDGFGETMSKSKGNGVDPLDIIDIYGTDALRYYVVSMAGETQDSGCRWRTCARTAAAHPAEAGAPRAADQEADLPEMQEAVPPRRTVADADPS